VVSTWRPTNRARSAARPKLSKFGNARLRRAFRVAAPVAIRQRENSFRTKYERYIARDRDNANLKRKTLTAITAKIARTDHAVFKTGADAKRKNQSQQVASGHIRDHVDNARVFRLELHLVFKDGEGPLSCV
jgi:hypothetical protein